MGFGFGSGMGFGKGDMTCRHKTVMAFGVIQFLMGVVVLGAGIFLITQKSPVMLYFYHGIWGAILLLLCGVFGIVGGLQRKKGLEIAFMVISIILTCGTWLGLMLISLGGAVVDSVFMHKSIYEKLKPEEQTRCQADAMSVTLSTSQQGYSSADYVYPCRNDGAVAANTAILAMGGMLFIVGILSASFACCAVCRCCGARNDDDSVAPSAGYGGYA